MKGLGKFLAWFLGFWFLAWAGGVINATLNGPSRAFYRWCDLCWRYESMGHPVGEVWGHLFGFAIVTIVCYGGYVMVKNYEV